MDKNERNMLTDSIPYSHISILDSRYDTTNIGFILDGFLVLNNTPAPYDLQHVVDTYYLPLLNGKDSLVIQLEKLSIQSKVIIDGAFIFMEGHIKARLFAGSNHTYTCLGIVDTLMEENYYSPTSYDLNKKNSIHQEEWGYYLLRLLEAAIRSASILRDSVQKNAIDTFSFAQMKREGLNKRAKPILKADSLHPGFYRDFSEFVNNNPTFEYVNDEALKNLLEVMHYQVGKNIPNEEPDTTYWGFCDGKNLYIRYLYSFYQLERKDCGFYIAATLDARRRDVKKDGWNALFGLMVLAGSIYSGSGPMFDGFNVIKPPDIPMVVIKTESSQIVGLELDWETGSITY